MLCSYPKQGDSSASKPSDDTQHPPITQINVASNVEVSSLADDTYVPPLPHPTEQKAGKPLL